MHKAKSKQAECREKTSQEPSSKKPRTTAPKLSTKRKSSMPESTPSPKEKSSRTSAARSTSSGAVLRPFWTELSLENSRKLPYQTATDCADLPSTSSSTSSLCTHAKSWFSHTSTKLQPPQATSQVGTSQTISSHSSTSLAERIIECERPRIDREERETMKKQEKKNRLKQSREEKAEAKRVLNPPKKPRKDPPLLPKSLPEKAWRYRLHPSDIQKGILRKWMAARNRTYNLCVAEQRRCRAQEIEFDSSLKALRAKFVNNGVHDDTPDAWLHDIPYDVRDEGMRDFTKALSNARQKFKETGEWSQIKFCNAKKSNPSIVVHSRHWNHTRGAYSEVFGKNALDVAGGKLPEILPYDARLGFTKLKEFYLYIPRPLDLKPSVDADNVTCDPLHARVIALDPGVRTFMTGYDPSGKIIECGARNMGRLYNLSKIADDIRSRRTSKTRNVEGSKKRGKRRRRTRMKKAELKVFARIRNLVDEMHRKFSLFLASRYDVILLPTFETSRMIRRGQRRIRGSTARKMTTWAHHRFRQFLTHKAREFSGRCRVVPVTEEYTSKTCGGCGNVKNDLGGSKFYRCTECGYAVGRDVNGARNILLKYLDEHRVRL